MGLFDSFKKRAAGLGVGVSNQAFQRGLMPLKTMYSGLTGHQIQRNLETQRPMLIVANSSMTINSPYGRGQLPNFSPDQTALIMQQRSQQGNLGNI